MKAFVEVDGQSDCFPLSKMRSGDAGVLTEVPDYEDEDEPGDPVLCINNHVYFTRSGDYIELDDTFVLNDYRYRPLAPHERIVITP